MLALSEIKISAINVEMTSLTFSDTDGLPIDEFEQFEMQSPLLYTLLEEASALFNIVTPYDAVHFVNTLFEKGSVTVTIEPSMGCKSDVVVQISEVCFRANENDFVPVDISA